MDFWIKMENIQYINLYMKSPQLFTPKSSFLRDF
eukprot:COSAG02_NODE_1607_length_11715_cov_298.359935_1_plen_34_part_00